MLSLVLQRVLPGERVQGTVLRDGGRLGYKFNGITSCSSPCWDVAKGLSC